MKKNLSLFALLMLLPVCAAAEEFEYMSGITTLQANAVEKTELAGEHIDKRTGLMYWETLDVAIPGNGGLDIEVYRSFGKHNASHFTLMRNWELELPRVLVPASPFGGIRGDGGAGVCNDPMPADFRRQIWTSYRPINLIYVDTPLNYYSYKRIYPTIWDRIVYLPLKGDPYHTGLKLIIPGEPIRYLAFKHGNAGQFPAAVKYVTADNWTAECVQTPNTGRYDGFLVTAPNGTRYRMDQIARTNGEHENFTQPGEVTLYASSVSDVRGNTLSYAYEVLAYPWTQLGEYLKTPRALIPLSISASDGRVVSFYYNRGPLYRITPAEGVRYSTQGIFEPPVVKIVAQGQEWNYIYTDAATLSEVRGPENWTWRYAYNGPPIGAYHANWWISDYFRFERRQARNHLSQITLPTGATVAYTYEGKSGDFWGGPANATPVYSLATRTLAGPDMSTGQWTYLVSKDAASTFLEIQGPTKVERFQYDGNYNSATYSRPLSRQIFPLGATDAANRTPLRMETYSWLDLGSIGVFPPGVTQLPVALNQRVVLGTRTVDNIFSTTYSNHNAYGNPGRIDESGHAKRTTMLTYFNNPANWIIGQLEDETVGEWLTDRTFDANGLLTKIVKLGIAESYEYHPSGDLWKKRWTKNNVPLEIVYESYNRGRPSLERHPEGVVIERGINPSGTLAWEKNGRGHVTRFDYDGLNRTQTIQPPVHATTNIRWPTPQRQVLARGNYDQSISYDGLGRELLTQRTDRSATFKTLYQKTDYDAGGRIRFKSYPSASNSEAYGDHTTYDALDRPLTLTRTSASANEQETTGYCYDAGCAHPLLRYGTIVTDARGYQTQYHQRVYGEPRQRETVGIRRQEQSVTRDGVDKYINTSFQRNLVGDILRVYQGGRNRSYAYFQGTRLPWTITHPETGLTTLGYDEIGNLTSRQVGASGVTTWVYDGRNRLKNIYYPKQTVPTVPGVILYYDKTDNLTLVNTGAVRRGYAYDANGNLTLDVLSLDNKSFAARYAYNNIDQLSTLTYPSLRQVSYLPDALDRPSVALPYVNNVTYHPNGTPQTLRYANGQVSTFGVNGRLWINRITTGNGATALSDIAYAYDPLGNTTSITDTDRPPQALRYDGLSRLIEAGDTRIDYDAADNITRLTVGSVPSTYNYDLVQNRLTSITGKQNATFSYDVYGNVAGNGRLTFAYDDASNLRTVAGAAINAAYLYDGHNRRVRTQTNGKTVYYLYAQDGNLLGEYDAAGVWTKEYAYLGSKLVTTIENIPDVAPGVPASLTLPAISTTGGYDVAWGAASSTVTRYELQEATAADFSNAVLAYSGPSSSWPTSGKVNLTYYYRIRACNGTACSAYRTGTNAVVVAIIPVPGVPGAPGVPASLTVPAVTRSDGSYNIIWGAASGMAWDSVTLPLPRYELEEATAPDFTNAVLVHSGGELYLSVLNRPSVPNKLNGTYYYRVRGCNGPTCGAYRTGTNSLVVNYPGVPSSISVPTSSATGTYTISWAAATGLVTHYELEESKYSTFPACGPVRCLNGICPKICPQATFQPYVGPALSFVVSGKTSGTYYYQVRACNDTGCSAFFPIQPTGKGAPAADAYGIVVTTP